MPFREELWSFETANFKVACYAEQEEMNPADSFDFEEDIEAVRSGAVDWFAASVVVTGPNGEELGADYLGGCAYTHASDFVTEYRTSGANGRNTLAMKARGICIGHHFPDMVRTAIAEARKNFTKLQGVKLRAAA